jgi:acetyltransferase-like isoleucine patch superfamily enzyme
MRRRRLRSALVERASLPSHAPPLPRGITPSPPSRLPVELRNEPPPLRGNVLTFLRFARENRMFSLNYAFLVARWAWLKLRWRGRLVTDGVCFVCPTVKFEIGRDARVHLGRWSWIGHGTKIRAHEGEVMIGAKSVIGQECTVSSFQHVSIGRECIVADRVMLIDFDHGVVEVERPIRLQGIYKRDVRVGNNVWIGYGACFLRGVTVGDNAIVGTSSVVTKDVPANAVVAGAPAKLVRMRPRPRTLRWG